jgi:hypothetical protein
VTLQMHVLLGVRTSKHCASSSVLIIATGGTAIAFSRAVSPNLHHRPFSNDWRNGSFKDITAQVLFDGSPRVIGEKRRTHGRTSQKCTTSGLKPQSKAQAAGSRRLTNRLRFGDSRVNGKRGQTTDQTSHTPAAFTR